MRWLYSRKSKYCHFEISCKIQLLSSVASCLVRTDGLWIGSVVVGPTEYIQNGAWQDGCGRFYIWNLIHCEVTWQGIRGGISISSYLSLPHIIILSSPCPDVLMSTISFLPTPPPSAPPPLTPLFWSPETFYQLKSWLDNVLCVLVLFFFSLKHWQEASDTIDSSMRLSGSFHSRLESYQPDGFPRLDISRCSCKRTRCSLNATSPNSGRILIFIGVCKIKIRSFILNLCDVDGEEEDLERRVCPLDTEPTLQ